MWLTLHSSWTELPGASILGLVLDPVPSYLAYPNSVHILSVRPLISFQFHPLISAPPSNAGHSGDHSSPLQSTLCSVAQVSSLNSDLKASAHCLWPCLASPRSQAPSLPLCLISSYSLFHLSLSAP